MEVAALRTLPSPLGAWVYCGFNPDILMGAMPEIARGLGAELPEWSGFEDRWGHRAPSSSGPYLFRYSRDPRNLMLARVLAHCPIVSPTTFKSWR